MPPQIYNIGEYKFKMVKGHQTACGPQSSIVWSVASVYYSIAEEDNTNWAEQDH